MTSASYFLTFQSIHKNFKAVLDPKCYNFSISPARVLNKIQNDSIITYRHRIKLEKVATIEMKLAGNFVKRKNFIYHNHFLKMLGKTDLQIKKQYSGIWIQVTLVMLTYSMHTCKHVYVI